jgi:thioredoxin reductase
VPVEATGENDRESTVDYLIVGGGPGGLQLGYFLEKADRNYLILEAESEVGSFFRKYPRLRQLISINGAVSSSGDEEAWLRRDWHSLLTTERSSSFGAYSERFYPTADELYSYLGAFAATHRLKIKYRTRVVRVSRLPAGGLRADAESGRSYSCRCLILATGLAMPYVPPVEGIEHAVGYESAAVDPSAYKSARVLIIGKGNSGFEVAQAIAGSAAAVHLVSPTPVQLAAATGRPGDVRASYSAAVEGSTLIGSPQILEGNIDRIVPVGKTYHVSLSGLGALAANEERTYDHVVRCTGFRFDDALLNGSSNGRKLPALSDGWQASDIDDVFFAGTLMQSPDRPRTSAGSIVGFRYSIRTLFRLLEARYFSLALESSELPARAEAVAGAMLSRAARSAALSTQYDELCDVVGISNDGRGARYYRELPLDLLPRCAIPFRDYLTLGYCSTNGGRGTALYPLVRSYSNGEPSGEHRLPPELATACEAQEVEIVRARSGLAMGRYKTDEHVAPLVAFLRRREISGLD